VLIEERLSTAGRVEIRRDGDAPLIGGYAAVFGKVSGDLGREQVDPRAFNMSRGIGWPHVLCRYNHDDGYLLGTVDGGTLELEVDKVGLSYTVQPPSTRADVVELVRRGDVAKSSFAFQVSDDEWGAADGGGVPLRTLLSVKLIDVAPCNSPAYGDSTVAMRSLSEHVGVPIQEVRELAEQRELRRLFTRTDMPVRRPGTSRVARVDGAAAARYLLDRRYDPYDR
jgi:Escherichia/Staphylococcus phage prohead protease